jgi:hypothetical protein
MALINCPECNKEASNQAAKCPNCGFPIFKIVKKHVNNNWRKDVLGIIIFGCIFVIMLLLLSKIEGGSKSDAKKLDTQIDHGNTKCPFNSLDDFKEKFNQSASLLDKKIYIGYAPVDTSGLMDTYSYDLIPTPINVIVLLNRASGCVEEVVFNTSSKDIIEYAMEIAVCQATLLHITAPKADSTQIYKVMNELSLPDKNSGLYNNNDSSVLDGNKYYTFCSNYFGLSMGVRRL